MLEWLFTTKGYMPRALCGPGWTSEHIAAANFADIVIFMSYLLIPAGLIRVHYRLTHGLAVPRMKLGVLLGVSFIVLCGLTHLSDRLMFFWPAYNLDTTVRLACALVSFSTVLWLSMIDMPGRQGG